MAKTTAAKMLAQETGISIQEAERLLDADAFWMSICSGNCVGFTTCSYYTRCSPTPWPLGKRNTIKPSARASNCLYQGET